MNIDRILVLSLFVGYTIKSAILGASLADAVVILGLTSVNFLYNLNIENKKMGELEKSLNELKSLHNDQNVIISELRTSVTGVKLQQSIRKA